MKMFPELVTFRITSRCNNDCKYCFGPQRTLEEMDFPKLKELFHHFHNNGVKAIVLTGGEPLIRDDFEKIIKEIRKCNLKIFLDTSGDLFFNYSDLILNNVDVIGLPIDFSDKSYRNLDNLNNILKIFDFFKGKEKRPTIRIGTVVTKDNIAELEKIGESLKGQPVDIWKIYEFTPQNANAIKNRAFLEVSSQEFNEAAQRVKEKFSRYFEIVVSKRKSRTNAYFFVASDGEVFIPVDDLNICREIKIGDVFDEGIVEKWEDFVSKINYLDNAKVTFNYKF